MSIDRRLRAASNELREMELAVPERVPRGSRHPTMALPVLMVVFGAALAMTGLDRTPGSDPVPESASIVVEAVAVDDLDDVVDDLDHAADDATASAGGAAVGGSYDIEGELQLIRELRRRPSLAQSSAAPASVVAAPDANAELALISALVNRPETIGSADADGGPTDAARSRPIAGLS